MGLFLTEILQSRGFNSNQKIKRSQCQSYDLKKRQKQQFVNNTPLFQKAKRYLKSKGKNISPAQEYMGTDELFGTILVVPNAFFKTGSILFPYHKSS